MKQAIIIPIYFGHRSRFVSLLDNIKSASFHNASLIFVATNLREKIYFSLLAYLKKQPVTILNLEKLANQLLSVNSRSLNRRLKVTAGIINLKKLLGLNACFSMGYERAVVIDSDILFFDNFNADELFKNCKKNYEKKVFYGVSHEDPWLSQIVESCFQYLNLQYDQIENKVYSWFFDVPYYESDDFNLFLTYIYKLHGDEWWSLLNSLTFDHLLFQYFLVSQRGWNLEDYSDTSRSIPELLSPVDLLRIIESRGYWPSWASYQCITAAPNLKGLNPDFQIIYHIDR